MLTSPSLSPAQCDGRQPSCTTCTKNRKVGCTYVRVTPYAIIPFLRPDLATRADPHRRADRREENLEVKARKRLAREQKAQYKALGIEPPPKLNAGRRRWEHNIRFEQQKLRGVSMPQQQQPAGASEPVVTPSPQGFGTKTTTTWRLGDSIQGPTPQSAPVATEERRGYFEHFEPATRSGQPQAPLSYAFPPVKPVCGPMPAYSPYPLTPPMDEYQPGPRLDGNNALGLFSPPEPYGNGNNSPWFSPSPTAAAAPVFATSRVPSLRLQRSVAFQPAPKPLHHVPASPESLSFVPSPRQVVPYPSPQMSTQFLPVPLPVGLSVNSPLLPPPAPLYAPDPTRPAATCDFVPRVAATPPLSERERSSPPPEQEDDPLTTNASLLSAASVNMPLSVLAQAAYPQTDFGHSVAAATAAATTSYEAPAVSAPTMFPSTSWSGSLYMPNARHPSAAAASYPTESWLVDDTHAHSTPELYSSAGW